MEPIILYVIFYIVYLVSNVLENYYREQERFTLRQGMGRRWHTAQYTGWVAAFMVAAYYVYPVIIDTGKILIVSAAVWWILYDGYLNVLKKRAFFYRSRESSSLLENIAYPPVKIGLLIISIILFYTI